MKKSRALVNMARWIARPTVMNTLVPFRGERVLPNFLIAGAPKCGTTSLFSYLCDHPGIIPPIVKEVNYFNDPRAFQHGEKWYRTHFPRVSEMHSTEQLLGYPPITGEGTPSMCLHAHAMNAHALLPDARIIMILRNPTERTYSQYQHQLRKFRRESLSFWDALQAEESRIAADVLNNEHNPQEVGRPLRRWGYVYKGKYIDQIEFWLKYYPRDQLLILNFEQFIQDPSSTCIRVADFLGLPEHNFQIRRALNTGGYKEDMEPRCREFLDNTFRPYNQRLFEFLEEDWGWPS
ncbi:MAG: sulfotransferase family protein [bacterium]